MNDERQIANMALIFVRHRTRNNSKLLAREGEGKAGAKWYAIKISQHASFFQSFAEATCCSEYFSPKLDSSTLDINESRIYLHDLRRALKMNLY